MNTIETSDYSNRYGEESFRAKIRSYAVAIGRALLEEALVLYYAFNDPDVPAWAKASIVTALGYLISPMDAIPDVIPVVGYSDDAGVIAAVILLVKACLKEEHRERARDRVAEVLG